MIRIMSRVSVDIHPWFRNQQGESLFFLLNHHLSTILSARLLSTPSFNPVFYPMAKEEDTGEDFTYQGAISALNSLQSNAAVIEQSRKERALNAWKNVTNTRFFVNTCGISDEQVSG